MKTAKLFLLLGLIFAPMLGSAGKVENPVPVTNRINHVMALNDEEPTTSSEYTLENVESECKVIVPSVEHGKIIVSNTEGKVGEYVYVNVAPDLFYYTEYVAVNGVNLIEDKNVTGQYLFQLVEGDNTITTSFAIDEEMLGEMTPIIQQALNKDWTNLFSVENVVRIVSFLLNGSVLVAISRYFIKDKRLEAKVEKKVEETMSKIIPDTTKDTVLATIREFITPYFAKIESEFSNVENAMTVFSRCLALAQENTPEARIAITKELSSLSLSDQEAISNVEKHLREFMEEQAAKMEELTAKLENIRETNQEIVQENKEVVSTSTEKEEKTDVEPLPYE